MNRIIIATVLSAFVVPGAGQLYNGERVKGLVLLVLTGALFLGFTIGLSALLAPLVPPGVMPSQDELRAILTRLMGDHESFFVRFTWLSVALWIYGVVDAFLGARESRRPQAPPAG